MNISLWFLIQFSASRVNFGNIHCIYSFFSEMSQVVKILPHGKQWQSFVVKPWFADVPATSPRRQGITSHIVVNWLCYPLTHWGRDKMTAISQTTLSIAFASMKMLKFRLNFHWSLFLRFPSTISQHLVQIMAWRRPGDKPLSEPMMFNLLTHICVTRPQWVNILRLRQDGLERIL